MNSKGLIKQTANGVGWFGGGRAIAVADPIRDGGKERGGGGVVLGIDVKSNISQENGSQIKIFENNIFGPIL